MENKKMELNSQITDHKNTIAIFLDNMLSEYVWGVEGLFACRPHAPRSKPQANFEYVLINDKNVLYFFVWICTNVQTVTDNHAYWKKAGSCNFFCAVVIKACLQV